MHQTVRGESSRAARLVLLAGILFVTLVAIAAILHGASLSGELLRALPRRMGVSGALALVLGIGGLAAAFMVGALAARSRLRDSRVLLLGLAAVLLVRGAAVLLMDAPLPNDGRAYQELARWLAAGNCCFADRPTGYPMLLAAAYRLVGDATWVHEALNVLAAVAGGALLWGLVRESFGRPAAAVSLFIFAVLPTQVLLTPVLLTDVVYATLLIGLCWAGARLARGGLWAALVAGGLLAVSQYVRPVAPALLPALWLVPVLFVRPPGRAMLQVAVLSVAFGIAMLPAVIDNLAVHGDLSVSTSSYGGWSLFMGTNQKTNGRYSAGDAAIIDALPGTTLWDRSEAAGQLGLDRITTDPAGFAGLVIRKFRVMWGTEEYGVIFGFRPSGHPRGGLAGLDLVDQLAFMALLVCAGAALVLLFRSGRAPPPVSMLVIGLLLCEAMVHTFLEVKPRYHAHTLPLLLVLASPALVPLARRQTWRDGWQRLSGFMAGMSRPAARAPGLGVDVVAARAKRRSGGSSWKRRGTIALILVLLPLATIELGVRALIAVHHLPVARAHSRDFEISWMNLERLGRVDVVILGDSVSQQGIYPDAIRERLEGELGRTVTVFNAASASGTLGVNLALARQLAEEDRLPPVAIVGVQPGILRDDDTLGIFASNPMGQLFTQCGEVDGLEATLGCHLAQVSAAWRWRGHLDSLLPAVLRDARRTSQRAGLTLRTDGFRAGFGLPDERLEAQLRQHLANRDDEFTMGAVARQRYLELVAFLREHGTVVVPVAVPEAPQLAAALEARHPGWDAEWHAALADLAQASGIAIADPERFGDWYGEGSMRNIKHLSEAGARAFTGQLLDMPAVHDAVIGGVTHDGLP